VHIDPGLSVEMISELDDPPTLNENVTGTEGPIRGLNLAASDN
jgi:hypothetical protein